MDSPEGKFPKWFRNAILNWFVMIRGAEDPTCVHA